MTNVDRNLGVSEPWGRATEKEIEDLKKRLRKLEGGRQVQAKTQSILADLVAKASVQDQLLQSQIDAQDIVTYADGPPDLGINEPDDSDVSEEDPGPVTGDEVDFDPGTDNDDDDDAGVPWEPDDGTPPEPEYRWIQEDPLRGVIEGEWTLVDGVWEPRQVGSDYVADGAIIRDKIEQAVLDDIDEANSNANEAVIAANGKNTIYRGPNSPTPPSNGFNEGDTWFDTAPSGVHTWTGTPNASTSTRTDDTGTVTNLFTNPDMVATEGEVVVWDSLAAPEWRSDPDLTEVENADGTFTYFGTQVAGLTATNGVVVQSTQWSKSGGVSARLIKTSGLNHAYASRASLSGGKSYLAWRYQEGVLDQASNNFGTMYVTGPFGTERSNRALNETGETLLTLHRENTGGTLVVYGSRGLGESVWFDMLTLADTEEYEGPPFSGSSRDVPGTVIRTWDGSTWQKEALGPDGIGVDSITETHISDDSISTPKLQANAVEANHIAANAVTAGKIATGSIVAGDGVIASLDAGVISTGTLDADRIGANTITGSKILVGSVPGDRLEDGSITGTLIEDGAITTGKIAADAIEANHLKANAVTAEKIGAGAVTARTLNVIAEEDNRRLSIQPDGVRLWGDVEAGGDPAIAITTSGAEYISITDGSDTVIGLDQTGTVSGQVLSAADDVLLEGESLRQWMEDQPQGIMVTGFVAAGGRSVTANGTQRGYMGLFEVSADFVAGRGYTLDLDNLSVTVPANGRVSAFARYTEDDSKPDFESSVLVRWDYIQVPSGGGSAIVVVGGTQSYLPTEDRSVRILVGLECRIAGSTTQTFTVNNTYTTTSRARLTIRDLGVLEDRNMAVDRTDTSGPSGSSGGGSTPPPKKTYTKTYNSTGGASYKSSGGRITTAPYAGRVTQGGGALGPHGEIHGAWFFGSPWSSDISGAAIKKVELYITNQHSYSNAGLSARVHRHTNSNSSAPNTFTSGSLSNLKSFSFSKGQGKWVDVTSIFTSTTRGFGLKYSGTAQYGYFSNSARVRITYEK